MRHLPLAATAGCVAALALVPAGSTARTPGTNCGNIPPHLLTIYAIRMPCPTAKSIARHIGTSHRSPRTVNHFHCRIKSSSRGARGWVCVRNQSSSNVQSMSFLSVD